LPITAYQAVGKDPEPLKPEPPVAVSVQDAAPAEGQEVSTDKLLTGEVVADSYQWYVCYENRWQIITDATQQSMPVAKEDFENEAYDFRCRFVQGETVYCTDSAKGIAYEQPQQETVPPIPEDFVPTNEQSFTKLEMTNEDEFAGYYFEMTFAEGEWVKEIEVAGLDDELAEADEFGTLTITDCDGGVLYDTANTFALHVVDNEAAQASQIGFELTNVKVDKSAGEALLTVKRTGGTQNVLSVDYTTADGTAVAGTDYEATSGTLMFYADITEMYILVPLINDGIETDSLKDFTITLSNVKGDGEGTTVLEPGAATVLLYNTNTAENMNLATALYDADAVDIGATLPIAQASIVDNSDEVVTGTYVEPEEIEPAYEDNGDGGIALFSFLYPFQKDGERVLNFTNGTNSWKSTSVFCGPVNSWEETAADYNQNWSGGTSGSNNSWKLESKGNASAVKPVADMAKLYSAFTANFSWRPHFASSWTLTWYGLEYTYPGFEVTDASGNKIAEKESNTNVTGKWSKGWHMTYSGSGSFYYPLPIDSTAANLKLYTRQYDAHDSEEAARAEMTGGRFTRRYFEKELRLRVYTANDGENDNGVCTAPENCAQLLADSDIYYDLKPTVALVDGKGGVTDDNQLYVGSQLNVDFSKVASESFTLANTDDNLSTVFITNAADNSEKTVGKGSGSSQIVTMLWNGMTDADIESDLTLDVIMTRRQNLKIDITPSVPRMVSQDGQILNDIDKNKIADTANGFWRNANITYGYSKADKSAQHFTYYEDGVLSASDMSSKTADPQSTTVFEKENLENLQWINFGLPEEDVIVYNGYSYKGNETIYLKTADLTYKDMLFRYYSEESVAQVTTMSATVSSIGIYRDGNGNGQIDGYYNAETGTFRLDETSGDTFECMLENGIDYDESIFTPTVKDGKIYQYFAKVYYSLTPRSLTVPTGASEKDTAQVLPAFITKVTDSATLETLSVEQKSYRYIVSGKSRSSEGAKADYTSDNRLMYTAAATKPYYVDIPLGGDTSPASLAEGATAYTWNPNYKGNLLYTFSNPMPITIPHSLAGEDTPIAAVAEMNAQTGEVTYQGDAQAAKDKLNGFLGSLTANDTFALCVQEQQQTTDEILGNKTGFFALFKAETVTNLPQPETVVTATIGTYPNSDYLKVVDTPDEMPTNDFTMADSGNKFPEFNLNMGTQLPSSEIGVTDYVSIVMDGYQVGFSIGVPLGGYSKNPVDGGANDGWKSPKAANGDKVEQMGKLCKFLKDRDMDSFKATDETYQDAVDSSKLKSGTFEVNFSLALAFMFKYNQLDNNYYFSEFSFAATAELEFKLQYRFSPCPIVYVYVQFHIEVEVGTGLQVERNTVLETTPYFSSAQNGGEIELKKGESILMPTTSKAFDIRFDGALYIESYCDGDVSTKQVSNPDSGFNKRGISSKGDVMSVVLYKQDGMEIQQRYILFTAAQNTKIYDLARATAINNFVYSTGFKFSPSAFVEAGIGVGVEIAKIEAFIKVSIGCSMTFGAYNFTDKAYDPFSFDEFEFALGAGLRVVFLFFNYELDMIRYTITYSSPDGWKQSWEALGGLFGDDISSFALSSGEDGAGPTADSNMVKISLPKPNTYTQEIYKPESESEISTFAFNPSSSEVPFQLSGYGSSSDAFKLIDGVSTGYDYRVVTVGSDNYVIYTVSREDADSPVDYTMLVLSKLQLTSANGQDSYGFVNPVNATDMIPFIILDTVEDNDGALQDDGTGDLGFEAWVTDGTIYAAWVSYATKAPSEPAQPDTQVYAVPLGVGTAVPMTL
ncbi:MAG: Calx-beta domain-containing protein, partial [Oscillospiraceae bacterium]|nr:Calx-beta domain-containing protein [Oscillospiraceae bacterium]